MEIFSLGTPAWPKRSMMCVSTPQVIGLTKPSGGGGVNAELIFSSCDTKEVGSFGDPVAHHDAAARPGDADHLLGDVEGLGSKHGAEYREGQIKRMVADPLQVARIALLKRQSLEPRRRGPLVPGVDEVLGDVDADDVRSQLRQGNRRRAISAAEVQDPQRRRDPERLDERLRRIDA